MVADAIFYMVKPVEETFLGRSRRQLDKVGNLRHFLTIDGLEARQLLSLLDAAQSFIIDDNKSVRKVPLLRGKTIINLFFESSTRTRSTFELAAQRLSADVLSFNINMAALKKGESLLDTIKNIHAMGVDMFVIRHPDSGAAEFIAEHIGDKACVINAGDGRYAHPTQALIDMFVIRKYKADFKNLQVAIVGDILHSRVARSVIAALTVLGVKEIRLIAPRTLIPVHIEKEHITVFQDMEQGIKNVDVLYILRLQKERMCGAFLPSEREYYLNYGITRNRLANAKPDVIVMHPGPVNRGVEVSSGVADGLQSVILEQVGFGIAVRMAVMSLILGNVQKSNEDSN